LQDQLASVLCAIFPHTDRCLFLKTGSEAVTAAIRLARAFTGKRKIIRCGYHGWHDSVMTSHLSWHLYEPDPHPPRPVAGVPQTNLPPSTLCWNGQDLQSLEDLFQAHRSTIAALLLDPVQLREPMGTCLKEVQNLTHDEGALLILDEIKTGFRVNLAGVQGLYNAQADLTILSKAISNGFALAVVLGRDEILELSGQAKIMGTYNNELVSLAAALKTISILERKVSIPWLQQIGQRLISGINEIFSRRGLSQSIQAVPYRWPCMPYIWFRDRSERTQRLKPEFYRMLANRGVLLLPNHMNFICLAHTSRDVQDVFQAVEDVLEHRAFS
jgi:glutamate-1-semialdehyde 2,1-aminomutase